MSEVVWQSIPNYEGLYEVSNYGDCRSLDRLVYSKSLKVEMSLKGKDLKFVIGKGKYAYKSFMLSKEGVTKRFRVHQLVANAFIPNPNNYNCINHKDGVKLNNHVSNLEWCSVKYNNQHAFKLGLMTTLKGSDSHFSKLIEYDVEIIKRMLRQGVLRNYQIAEIFGVDSRTVSGIKHNQIWKHVK